MRTQRWLLAVAGLCIGCGNPEFGGEKGALKFQFGLSGCTTVNASQTALASGGTTVLVIGDPQARMALDVSSDSPQIVAPHETSFELACDQDCKSTSGRVTLDALTVGTARLVFSAGGQTVDALDVRVKEATALRLEDDKGASGEVSVNRATPVTLVARLSAGNDEVIAGTPYVWSREGEALEAPTGDGDRATLKPTGLGRSTVRAQWGDLSATIVVKVE